MCTLSLLTGSFLFLILAAAMAYSAGRPPPHYGYVVFLPSAFGLLLGVSGLLLLFKFKRRFRRGDLGTRLAVFVIGNASLSVTLLIQLIMT